MTLRLRPAALLLLAAAAFVLVHGIGAAPASHSTTEQVSIGATGGNGAQPTQFVGASADGPRVFLRPEEPLAPTDTDTFFDLFVNDGGAVSQLTIGPAGGNDPFGQPFFRGSSKDGSRAFFEAEDPLVAADTDDCDQDDPAVNGCLDVYERANGVTTLISTGPTQTNDRKAEFEFNSDDGSVVFFRTEEGLVASDTDGEYDVYERSGGTTKLVSTGSAGGNGSFPAYFHGASADGSRAFFVTDEQLVAADTDSSADVYQRAGGVTTLISTGPSGGNGAFDATYRGTTSSGTQVYIETAERLTSGDTDNSIDVYERSGSTTTLVSTGPSGGNGAQDARFKKVSEGGTRVFFQTAEALTSGDTDTAIDVYERSGGATTLISSGGGGNVDALLQDVSSDGSVVVLGTTEQLTAADTDSRFDVYTRSGATTTLQTSGPSGGNGDFDAYFDGMSRDGKRIFFETLEQLANDTDSMPDVYERFSGATTKISTGPTGGNGTNIAVFVGTSDDGSRVFFSTLEKLVSADTDSNVDVYAARIATGYARPKGATPLRAALVLAYKECTAPNRLHGPPALGGGAADASCAPPVQASDFLTVGTADANGRAANSVGSVIYTTLTGNPSTPADEADVKLEVSITDVRRKSDLADYTGELVADAGLRLTDRFNGSAPIDTGTVADMSFPIVVPCVGTSDTAIGSTCSVTTTADSLVPGAVVEGSRAIWQLGQVVVNDGGADGQAATAPNTTFAREGIFIP
jgi:hypothetical protein